MGSLTVQPSLAEVLAIADRQRNLVTHGQLIALGLHRKAIAHRVSTGRLHRIRRGVYAVGSSRIDLLTDWLAAVLACGVGAVLSHDNAAAVWGVRPPPRGAINVSVPARRNPREPGVAAHRRARLEAKDVARHRHIPVTSLVLTFVDIAGRTTRSDLEAAINEADKCDLIDPEALRAGLAGYVGLPGAAKLGGTLDRRTFTLTHSELERRFLPIARRAGLPPPLTQQFVNGFRVDFYWPEIGLVVETDGLRYHRTAAQQSTDLRRDQAHTAAGLTQLRFARAQVVHEPGYVEETLRTVARGGLEAPRSEGGAARPAPGRG